MDELSFAGSFMSLIGLLYSYQSNKDFKNLEGFIQWLYATNQHNTAKLIEQNDSIKSELDSLLNKNHDELKEQLEKLNQLMLSISNNIDGLKGLSKNFELDEGLSEQAINILRQLVRSNGEYIWISIYTDGIQYSIDLSEDIEVKEPRFIEDDLEMMSDLGLLTHTFSDKTDIKYRITRKAVKLIDVIDSRV